MINIINFVIKYWKLIAVVICFVGGIFVGFYISNKMWQSKYDGLEAKYNGCQDSLSTCFSANEENINTIEKFKKELKMQQQQCEQRIKYYKQLINQFQQIDNLTGGKDENSASNCPDDVCNMLNGMWK